MAFRFNAKALQRRAFTTHFYISGFLLKNPEIKRVQTSR